jgi:alkanesulfonate monooxygenase SsuD/methylene tetrahydromethanopterin reductase-like flavin-dependent oxidoreductase (luciferase family)
MKVAIGGGVDTNENWNELTDYVVEAENLGVDSVWSAEAWGLDGATTLAYLAAKTSKIKLGSGILQTVGRTPANLAMTAMSLASMSGGRFILGLGASGPQVVASWHGVPFDKPITRIRELIEIVRIIASGEKLAYDGKIYHLPLPGGEGKSLRIRAQPQPNIPIYLATLSPRSLELTGEVANGWIGTSFMPEHPEVFFDYIEKGAKKADKLIERNRPGIAFTLGAMGSPTRNFYNAAFRRAGYDEDAIAVQKKWIEGDRAAAVSMVPDEMVLQVNLLGTDDMVRERIRKYRDAGVTTLRLAPSGHDLSNRLETLGRAMNLVKEVSRETAAA